MKGIFSGIVASLVISSVAFAAPPAITPQVEKKLPPSGSLSTSISTGAVSNKVPEPWGGTDPSGREIAPISGSVSRMSKEMWRVKVFNNSEDTYSVTVDVVQTDAGSRTVKTDSFSFNLPKGRSEERDVLSASNAKSADLNLRHYRNLTAKKKTPTPAATEAKIPQ